MAKYTTCLRADFDHLRDYLSEELLSHSLSATLEDSFETTLSGVRCSVMVFERFSIAGSNRVSLTLTLLSDGPDVQLAAITAGGSQAIFCKLNTLGEEAFLQKLREAAARYPGAQTG